MNSTDTIKKLSDFTSTASTAVKKILNPLSKVLTFSPADDTIYPEKNVSISIERGSFAIVYGSRFLSKLRINNLKTYSLEESTYPQPEVIASSLALAIHDFGASRVDVSLSIPKAWAVIRTAEFPAAVKENLSNVISYELDRITPFSSENAFYDYRVLNESPDKIAIVVVAARADLIRPYIEALIENGINVNKVTINLSGIETLCRYMDKISDSIFIEIKKNGYEGALFYDGLIIESFTGFFNTEEEQSKIDSIATEIKPLIEKMQSSDKLPQIMILLRDQDLGLKDTLKQRLTLPIKILNETDIKLKISGKIEEIPYAAVGGVIESLWPKAVGFNLLAKGQHEKPGSPKLLTLILIIAIFALWIIYLIAPLRIEGKKLEEIEHQIMLRKEEVKKVEVIKKEIEALQSEILTISNFKVNRPMVLNILKELTTILPKNAWLSRVRVSDKSVYIEGYASSATGLLPKLEASAYFKRAEFASPTFRDTRMNADRFNIKMEIEGIKPGGVQKESKEELTDEKE